MQCGSQVNDSMEYALLQLINDIAKSFEKRQLTLPRVFYRPIKVFDTVNHNIVIAKPKYYGISGEL